MIVSKTNQFLGLIHLMAALYSDNFLFKLARLFNFIPRYLKRRLITELVVTVSERLEAQGDRRSETHGALEWGKKKELGDY